MSDELEQLQRSWILNAQSWTDAVREDRIESRRTVTNAAIVNAVLEQRGSRVLDVGCGEGWLVRALARHGREVTGVDASAPLIEAGRASGEGTFLVVSYEEIIADATVCGGPFDTIVANFSLLDDRAGELLAALRTVLSDDGRLVIQTVHPMFGRSDGNYVDGWCTETFSSMPGEWAASMPWYFRTMGSWLRLLVDAGYVVLEAREPLHVDRNAPASLLFICAAADASRS